MRYSWAVPAVAETINLMDSIVRLRRAEEIPDAASDVAPVRRRLESQLGPTVSRSRASRILGVSQTALDRWVAGGQIPVVVMPNGRREIPSQVVIELRESIDGLKGKGVSRHPLSAALAERRDGVETATPHGPATARKTPLSHDTAARRSLAYHRELARRLDERMIGDARERLERLIEEGHLHPLYAERWREILALPTGRVAEEISADTEEASDLRQNTPFAGVLNEHERRRIVEAVR